jgi:hypothetical protein
MTTIFINYRTGDETFAPVHLEEKLAERFGADNVFRDSRTIGPGLDFRPELWGSLARSSVLLVVIGSQWLVASRDGQRLLDRPEDYVRREVAMALQIGIRVVPVLVGDIKLPRAEDLPSDIKDLAYRQYLRLHSRTAQHDMMRLIDGLAEILESGESAPAEPDPSPAADPVAPTTAASIGFQFLGTVDAREATFVHGDQINSGRPKKDLRS